jgi:hypothetical protein
MSNRLALALSGLTLVIASCGNPPAESAGPIADRTQSSSDRYLPLAVGAVWTFYDVEKATGQTGHTRSAIERLENVGGTDAGVMAYRVNSTTLTGSTINWQLDEGNKITRLREQFFDASGTILSDYDFMPHKVRLDETAAHTQVGASWTETYMAIAVQFGTATNQTLSYTVTWTVEAVDEEVTVRAGTFKCLRVRRLEPGGVEPDRTYFFARHVGKVKEEGSISKELTGYSIPSAP